MTIQKITNPLYVGEIAELIMKFYNRVKDSSGMYDGITYESLYVYITRVVQMGSDKAEFWVAYDNDKPAGFALWRVMDLPYVGTVFCEGMYNDVRNQKAIKELYDEFFNFGRKHRTPLYQYYAVNEKVGEYFKTVGEKMGVKFKDSGAKTYVGREV